MTARSGHTRATGASFDDLAAHALDQRHQHVEVYTAISYTVFRGNAPALRRERHVSELGSR